MWIKTQWGSLVNLDTVQILDIENDEPMIYAEFDYHNEHYVNLGEYETQERAMEVLDEIQQAIIGQIYIPSHIEGSGQFDSTGKSEFIPYIEGHIESLPTVYEMPKE